MINQNIPLINKEEVHHLQYPMEDVLTDKDDRSIRRYKLERALKLGNRYKSHVKIVIKGANNRIVETEATIWAVTDRHISLKSGMVVPIRRILDVKFY